MIKFQLHPYVVLQPVFCPFPHPATQLPPLQLFEPNAKEFVKLSMEKVPENPPNSRPSDSSEINSKLEINSNFDCSIAILDFFIIDW